MTEESMVERVARGMCRDQNDDWATCQDMYRGRARIAIACMREPTEAMMRTFWERARFGDEPRADEAWNVLIDAALKETP